MTATAEVSADRGQAWPSLPLTGWKSTLDTLQRWMQIVGKTRLALAPAVNHWWHVTLYLTGRGLSTSAMPHAGRTLEVEFDFVDHRLLFRASDGGLRAMALGPRTVADFHREYLATLVTLGFHVPISPVPNELEDAVPFSEDTQHRSYDPEAVSRCFKLLSVVEPVFQEFRGRFLGKSSPVHFFWGAFDLACTRFSGRRASRAHPGGVPHLPDRVVREAYSHECISAGWWPGGGPLPEPAFYSYAYPEPEGFREATVDPVEARYEPGLSEFVLPYEAVRTSHQPREKLLAFLQSAYEAGADLGGWDRTTLERGPDEIRSGDVVKG